MSTVQVAETFLSVQGESTYAGLSCFFIRLAGCNLRCTYCDTPQAFDPGDEKSVTALAGEAAASVAAIVEVTGGEPLLQDGFAELASALRDETERPVLVETNGSVDISVVPEAVIAIVDVKCPGSGEEGSFDLENLARLRAQDEVKFVIRDRADYEWATAFVRTHALAGCCRAVHFSPVHECLDPRDMAEWLLADGPAVRLQVPLHKLLKMR